MNNQQWQSMSNQEQVKWWANNAPDGATHAQFDFAGDDILWVSKIEGVNECFYRHKGNHKWHHTIGVIPPHAIKKPEPATPEWNGEGLPPVGTECEYFDRVKEGREKAFIVAHHMNGEDAIWSSLPDGDQLFYGGANDFRPIQTKEQREREALVVEFADHLRDSPLAITSEYQRQIAEHFIDAGWRRIIK